MMEIMTRKMEVIEKLILLLELILLYFVLQLLLLAHPK